MLTSIRFLQARALGTFADSVIKELLSYTLLHICQPNKQDEASKLPMLSAYQLSA